jgi:dGTP triphosphohydrolase
MKTAVKKATSGTRNKIMFEVRVSMPVESYCLYRYAYSEKQALERVVSEIAKEQEVLKSVVWNYIQEHPKCYVIERRGNELGERGRKKVDQ